MSFPPQLHAQEARDTSLQNLATLPHANEAPLLILFYEEYLYVLPYYAPDIHITNYRGPSAVSASHAPDNFLILYIMDFLNAKVLSILDTIHQHAVNFSSAVRAYYHRSQPY